MLQLWAAEEELTDSTGLTHGSIAIGASETALNIYLLDKLKEFHMKYPGIRLKIYNHSTPQAIEAVKSGMIDFAVVSTPAAVEAPLKEIVLESFQEVLVGGRTFMALGSQEISLWELKNYPLLASIQASPVSFLLGFDSANRLRLFAEDDALTDYVASFRTVAPAAIFVGDGQQFNNQHMNQTLVLAAFE